MPTIGHSPPHLTKDRIMLVLGRKRGQSILIGDDIEITVTRVHGEIVRIGIQAPPGIKILRKELKTTDDKEGHSD